MKNPIPTAAELEEWARALRDGYALTGFFPRFLDGYQKLLKVAMKARLCTACDGEKDRKRYWIAQDPGLRTHRLQELDDALEELEG